MADQPSIFNTETNTSTQTQQTDSNSNGDNVQINESLANLLKDIKNERGEQKYSDPLAAIKALQHSQAFIPELKVQLQEKERELAEAKAKAERAEELERTIAELTKQQTQTQTTNAPVFDESKIADLVQQTINKSKAVEVQQANLNLVVSTLQSVIGADAEKTFYEKGAELGMTKEELNTLAATKPKAVLQLFNVNAQTNKSTQTTQGTVNTSAFQATKESKIGRNKVPAMVGATTQESKQAFDDAKEMVEELHAQGLTVHDLSDPKVYHKYFK